MYDLRYTAQCSTIQITVFELWQNLIRHDCRNCCALQDPKEVVQHNTQIVAREAGYMKMLSNTNKAADVKIQNRPSLVRVACPATVKSVQFEEPNYKDSLLTCTLIHAVSVMTY